MLSENGLKRLYRWIGLFHAVLEKYELEAKSLTKDYLHGRLL